ncbi:MAG: cupin domain-containing protein [Lachnospiraceae bacterium]|nr:cupin domain-containing protein [Lachnospiraceae bacterium]
MKEEIREIGQRIRELREICDCTAEELAHEIDVPLEVYLGYEANGENIPISVIYAIAKKFKVDFSEIISGTSAKLKTYQVVRKGDGQSANRYPGYHFEDLAYHFSNKVMQPFIVVLDPSEKEADLVTHSGEEFNLVLEGCVIVNFDGKDLVLNEGDSIYFDPSYPHGQRCGSDKPAKFLTMIAELKV